jgi:gas vesicle protein
MGACVGGLVGFGAALVWASRQFTGRATRKALQLIGDTRDAHWLKANPIDYA